MHNIAEATSYIQQQYHAQPRLGIILGTGLGSLVDEVQIDHSINYQDIPHFPVSTVESHSGRLIIGRLANVKVVVMQGRFHYYEGYSMKEVTFPVRVMKNLGIEKLFISNAAGSLNPVYNLSDLMVINDHINLQPDSPLRGANLDSMGPRFPDMSDAYDNQLIGQAMEIAAELNIPLSPGCLCFGARSCSRNGGGI